MDLQEFRVFRGLLEKLDGVVFRGLLEKLDGVVFRGRLGKLGFQELRDV